MKSLALLWCYVAEELATWCRTSTSQDVKYVLARTKAEGNSFLTITLASFCKDFERSLDKGYVESSSFTSFKKVRDGAIPAFLQGMLARVFDRQTGRLSDNPDIDCIRAIRQLTLMFNKVLIDCTPSRQEAAIHSFVTCEKEVREKNEELSMEALNELSTMSFLLYGNIFDQMEREFLGLSLLPKHGPGATADRLKGNQKFDLPSWPLRLEHSFPYGEYAQASPRSYDFGRNLDHVNFLESGSELPVRVTLVPKTLKTPRIIAIEPTAMQYAQQALLVQFTRYLEDYTIPNDYFGSRLNRVHGMIGFTTGDLNQSLAREGSLFGNLATLDLKEASDRVSNLHVMAMFSRFPHLMMAIQDCRSTKADVPGYGIIPLSKFASMGSALCFPMEAMVFLSIIFLGIQDEFNRPLTVKDILSFTGRVRVFGDDLIIPKEYVRAVMHRLALYGYKVNSDKSFWNGKFRESCGGEFYAGVDVSIQRVRRELPVSRTDVLEIVSLVSFRNRLFEAGFRTAVEKIDRIVEKFLPHYPLIRPTSRVLGRYSDHPSLFDVDRMSIDTQKPQVKGFFVTHRPPTSPVSGEGALLKFFIKKGDEPIFDAKHLERQGRPEAVTLKLGWSSPL